MIPTIRITKNIVIQKHLDNGLKMYVKVRNDDKDKWYCLKLDDKDFEYFVFGINCIRELL